MRAFTALYSRKIVGFLLTALVLSGGFFYAPNANATGEREVYLLVENSTGLSIIPNSGATVIASDSTTYTDEFTFSQIDGTQFFGIFITSNSYKIRFQTSASLINLSIYSGVGEGLDSSLHYYDLSQTVGTHAEISVTNSAITAMKFDLDNNGSYETTPTASYSRVGSSIADSDEPFLTYDQDGTTLTVDAEEATAVKKIYYSFTLRTGRLIGNASVYSSPLSLSGHSQGDKVYFMAEDTVGNRGVWEEYIIIESTSGGGGGGGTTPTPTPTPTSVQIPTPTPTTVAVPTNYLDSNINCSGTIYYVNRGGGKEGYPSAAVFFAWNTTFAGIPAVDAGTCASFPTGGLTRLPNNSLVKVDGNKTVWKIDGTVAYPIATYEAMLRIQAQPKIITIDIPYLHTYSGGGAIY